MNCLFSLNIRIAAWNAGFITDHIRSRFVNACHRWGCDYAELEHFDQSLPSCHWGKLDGPIRLVGYEKLLYLDGDMVISDHAPNPFDLCVDGDTIYCVTDAQGVNPNPIWLAVIYGSNSEIIRQKFPDYKQPPVEQYFNSGFMMFRNTESVRSVFRQVRDCSAMDSLVVHEQTILNTVAYNKLKVALLPEEWNFVVSGRQPNPKAYINHYVAFTHFSV